MKDIKLNSKNMRDMLRSEKVRQMCEDTARKGLASAGDGAEVDSDIGPNRARAALIGRASEMDGALDAMRH